MIDNNKPLHIDDIPMNFLKYKKELDDKKKVAPKTSFMKWASLRVKTMINTGNETLMWKISLIPKNSISTIKEEENS